MKYDKVITVVGVVILLIAGVGIYFYKPPARERFSPTGVILTLMEGELKDSPSAIEVADTNPFYPLIVTPLAVHYDKDGNRYVVPLYVKNMSNPSKAILRAEEMIGKIVDLVIDEDENLKNISLNLVKRYWKKSDIAIIMKDDREGYEVGLVATPIASYLTAPVVVTDKIDSAVIGALSSIKVKYILTCGNLSTNAFSCYHIENAQDALNITIDLVEEKFGEIDYITITNPVDAWPPAVLDEVSFYFGPTEVKSTTMTDNQLKFILREFTAYVKWNFTIPKDYKYALIEFEGFNHVVDGVEKFGDSAVFTLQFSDGKMLAYLSTRFGIPVRDLSGSIIKDRVYAERVLYDYGGKKIYISARGRWATHDSGLISARVTVKKLSSPLYPMMKKLSCLSPYLTAYHRGIVFAKANFAFVASDNTTTRYGEKCPGYYMPSLNPKLVPLSNDHVFTHIHEPLNKLLAKLRDIPYDGGVQSIKMLRESYYTRPIYIAVVGDPTVVPRYFYENEVEPLNDTHLFLYGGGGTQSDSIYGDIDPVRGDWSNCAQDMFTDYPVMENMVGRLVGWDSQDLSALITRTIFYDKIVENLNRWRDSMGIIVGGGLDFAKPLPLYLLTKILPPSVKKILEKISMGYIDLEGPWKYETGFEEVLAETLKEKVGKELDFRNIEVALDTEGLLKGLDDALHQIKRKSIRNRLVFNVNYIRSVAGESVAKGKEILEGCNIIFITAHGSQHYFDAPGPDLVAAGFDGWILNAPRIWQKIIRNLIPPYVVGFWGPGGDLERVGSYSPRSLSTINMYPSVMWLDSCFCGKINGMYPKETLVGAFLHAGLNALIASSTSTNIAGGYLEPKKHVWDTLFSTWKAYRQTKLNMKRDIYPDLHFGPKIFSDMCMELSKNKSLGRAFRDAKNDYLPQDADWELWWSPPLTSAKKNVEEGYGKHLPAKYTTFYEYNLYGDPAFKPYIPKESDY